MSAQQGRKGRPWRQICARVYLEETHCWWCGQWVDHALPWTDPMSRTVDHLHELHRGGAPLDRANCALMHRRCNSEKSSRIRAQCKRETLSVNPARI